MYNKQTDLLLLLQTSPRLLLRLEIVVQRIVVLEIVTAGSKLVDSSILNA
jgi:hypothetical protein